MPQAVATVDLRTLDLAPGAEARRRLRVPPVELRLGGQDYRTEPASPEVELRVARSLSGLHLRLSTEVELVGPCWRCLEPARVPLSVRTDEFAAEGRPADAPFDEDLDSPYVADQVVDVAGWTRDAIAEAVPAVILCREDCAGLCGVCGADLNQGDCGHRQEQGDPRWGALRGLAERLGVEEPREG